MIMNQRIVIFCDHGFTAASDSFITYYHALLKLLYKVPTNGILKLFFQIQNSDISPAN